MQINLVPDTFGLLVRHLEYRDKHQSLLQLEDSKHKLYKDRD